MQYATFLAVWLLSSLILGVVHGPAMGTLLGLAIACGYFLAIRRPALLSQRGSRMRSDGSAAKTQARPAASNR
jgi:hypothetical protein